MQRYPVYIPSKNRAGKCRIYNRIGNLQNYFFVVEPQDYESYCEAYGEDKTIAMPENDMGIAYARRFIMKYSLEKEQEFSWQSDDDLYFFRYNRIIKPHKAPVEISEAFAEIETLVDKFTNVAIAGPSDGTFALAYKNKIDINRQASSCYLLRNDTAYKFRDNVTSDTDYNMQVLTGGWVTLMFRTLIFNNPATGKQTGGCLDQNWYANQRNLMRLWPSCFEQKHYRVGTNHTENFTTRTAPSRIWGKFQQRPILKDQHNG